MFVPSASVNVTGVADLTNAFGIAKIPSTYISNRLIKTAIDPALASAPHFESIETTHQRKKAKRLEAPPIPLAQGQDVYHDSPSVERKFDDKTSIDSDPAFKRTLSSEWKFPFWPSSSISQKCKGYNLPPANPPAFLIAIVSKRATSSDLP